MSEENHWQQPTDDHWQQPADDYWHKREETPYWQGDLRISEHARSDDEAFEPSYGSMSTAARRSYASESIRQKDHVSAGLLAIFLGLFGVHKFYLGCNNTGFIMLAVSIIGGICTFGLAAAVIWILAIIEGFIYFSKTQTEFERIYVLNQRDWF